TRQLVESPRTPTAVAGSEEQAAEEKVQVLLELPDGSLFEGQWRHRLAEGCGKLQLANGGVYDGQWSVGYANGLGRFTQT
ncbi:MORN3, partial [Symbiodinium pilosum]